MNDLRTLQHDPFETPFDRADELSGREDWEDWDDDALPSPTETLGEERLVDVRSQTAAASRSNTKASDRSQYRSSIQKPARLKSRLRQKAQNEKAGIKLVTDMSKFKKQQQHIAQQMRSAGPDRRTGKFVNAAALRALEGSPNESSVGNWHWLKRKQGANGRSTTTRSPQNHNQHSRKGSDLSPDDRPIVIGIAMPEDDLAERTISPRTATLDSPPTTSLRYPFKKKANNNNNNNNNPSPRTPSEQPRSVWSPDTPQGASPPHGQQRSRATSNAYSEADTPTGGDAPPVPGVPFHYRHKPSVESVELDDDDNFSPVTLFEEDGSPRTRSPAKKKGHSRSPATTIKAQSGWWDHVHTPFVEQQQQQNNPFAPPKPKSPEDEQPKQKDEWWKGADEKKATSPRRLAPSLGILATGSTSSHTSRPSPTVASSSRSPPPTQTESFSDKARILAEENQTTPTEEPPPYEATSKQDPVKYRAVFPPGHPLRSRFPPSPGPVSPALAGTMTSQGAIGLTDVPLTPAASSSRRSPELGEGAGRGSTLPDRPQGSYAAAADHFGNAVGRSPAAKIERQRRRHEKEDAVAHRVEGFWRGRGCIPENGCYGRRGREGRQRRRIWCILIVALLIAIILAIALAVTLTHKAASTVLLNDTPASTFLNVSGFPPIPTGVNTVVGPDSRIVDGCVSPPTLWTCSLPKEQQQSNKPYRPDQPEFVFQIQYDSSPRQLWNVPDGAIPTPTITASPTSSSSSSSSSCVAHKPSDNPDSAIPVNCGVALMSQLANQTSPNSTVGDGGKGDEIGKGHGTKRATLWGRIRSRLLFSRADASAQQLYDTGFQPKPDPPPFAEYWFLGNTTDGIVSSRKAGEPTPFYITFLPSLDSATAGPNVVRRRGGGGGGGGGMMTRWGRKREEGEVIKRGIGNGIPVGPDANISRLLPPPALNPDGTGAPAVLRPHPFQQPLRLFDRGLATEHYGFYTYFDKTTYVRSINGTDAADTDGGSLEKEASHLVSYTQLRFHVQIWTRVGAAAGSTATLLGGGAGATANNSTRPGSFPLPITISEDQHGGDFNLKGSFARGVDSHQKILTDDAHSEFVIALMNFGGSLINHDADPSFGGVDGGTGGCKCAWRNFVQ